MIDNTDLSVMLSLVWLRINTSPESITKLKLCRTFFWGGRAADSLIPRETNRPGVTRSLLRLRAKLSRLEEREESPEQPNLVTVPVINSFAYLSPGLAICW